MEQNTRNLIQSRARRLAPFLADYLQHQDSGDWEKGQAYRFVYLLLRGPRAFLEQFRFSDMRVCEEAIQSVYWELRGEFPGPGELLSEERIILRDHNLAAAEYQAKQEQRPPVVTYTERVIGLAR